MQLREHVNFADPEMKYEALPYTIGGDKSAKRVCVLLDKKETPVYESLEVALRYLRYSGRDRLLWIDAICINQVNSDDKDHEVADMDKIYKNASTVLIWLGISFDARKAAATRSNAGGTVQQRDCNERDEKSMKTLQGLDDWNDETLFKFFFHGVRYRDDYGSRTWVELFAMIRLLTSLSFIDDGSFKRYRSLNMLRSSAEK